MTPLSHRLAASALVLGGLALPGTAYADTLLTGDYSIDGGLCAGETCTSAENYPGYTLKLKDPEPGILFQDTSTVAPSEDWQISINDDIAGGNNYFAVADQTSLVFRIYAGAPAGAFNIASDGRVGLNTIFPLADIHVVSTDTPRIRLDQLPSESGAQIFDIGVDPDAFFIAPKLIGGPSVRALQILPNAVENNLLLSDGRVGVNRYFPLASLHVTDATGGTRGLLIETNGAAADPHQAFAQIRAETGDTRLRIDELSVTTAPRTLLELQNNGRPEIVMGNAATGDEWSFGAGTNFILKQGAVGSASSAKTKLFEIAPTGNATLAGTLTTGGTTCGGGCDRVFTENAVIPQADYAATMWAQGYLPYVGPTPEGAPLDISQKLGGMLNALEHAHVFIDRQTRALAAEHARNRDQAALIDRQQAAIEALSARLAALEATARN